MYHPRIFKISVIVFLLYLVTAGSIMAFCVGLATNSIFPSAQYAELRPWLDDTFRSLGWAVIYTSIIYVPIQLLLWIVPLLCTDRAAKIGVATVKYGIIPAASITVAALASGLDDEEDQRRYRHGLYL